jgi:hypothetical protein
MTVEKDSLTVTYTFEPEDYERIRTDFNRSPEIFFLTKILPLLIILVVYGLIIVANIFIGFGLFDYIFIPFMFVLTLIIYFLFNPLLSNHIVRLQQSRAKPRSCSVCFSSSGITGDLTNKHLDLRWD